MAEDKAISTLDVTSIVRKKYLEYAEEVIIRRALTKHEDGLKPVQRYTLYAMHHDLGLKAGGLTRKCAKVVGVVIGTYHPHGDQSAYGALVSLSQPWVQRYPLITFQGNNGSMDGDKEAAMRYTECKLSRIGESLLDGINKNAMNMVPNFDDTEKEPEFLPGLFPTLLANGTAGIATGMAAKLAPHYAPDVFQAIKYVLNQLVERQQPSLDEVIRLVKAPDFPTGGILINPNEVRQGYRTGHGRCVLRCKYHIENGKLHDRIVVTELPYGSSVKQVSEAIGAQIFDKENKVLKDNISDVIDESGKKGMRLVIVLKRNANPDLVMNILYKCTGLQNSFVFNNTTLVNGRPMENLNLLQLIQLYCQKQCKIKLRTTQYELNEYKERLEVLAGLIKADSIIDDVIACIRATETSEEVVPNLMSQFQFTERQAKAIDARKMGSLNRMNVTKLANEQADLTAKAQRCEQIINNPIELIKALIEDIDNYVNNGGYFKHDERRTEICECAEKAEDIAMVPEEDIVMIYTHNQMLKAVKSSEYNAQKRNGVGQGVKIREGDFVEKVISMSNHDNLMVISNKGRAYMLPAYRIPVVSKAAMGKYLNNYVEMQEGEEPRNIILIKKDDETQNLLMVTKQGYAHRITLEGMTIRRNGLNVTRIEEGDELVSAVLVNPGDLVTAVSHNGMAIRACVDTVSIQGRTARGVSFMKFKQENDYVVCAVNAPEETAMLVVTERGLGKRFSISDVRITNRGSKGVIVCKPDKIGHAKTALKLEEGKTLFCATSDGRIIRIPTDSIRQVNRSSAGGVSIVKLEEGQNIVSVTAAPAPEEEEDV